MLLVRFDNGEEQEYNSSEQAEQAIQDVLLNGDAESAELVQDGTVVAEYSEDEFEY